MPQMSSVLPEYNELSLVDILRSNEASRLSPLNLLKFRKTSTCSNFASDFSTCLAS